MEPFAIRLVRPYAVLSNLLAVVAVLGQLRGATNNPGIGYVALCAITSILYSYSAVLLPLLHARESSRAAEVRILTAIRRTCRPAMAVTLLACVLPTIALVLCWEHLIAILTI
jgi:hypothetical protein